MKRIAAIHDISGFGRCSLTVALPIISAAGIECAIVPTAVLSTHTGGFQGFTYRDLTGDIEPFYRHWQELGLKFDAFYSGFLGSVAQIDIISGLFGALKSKNSIIAVDPVMADNGVLYSIFTPDIIAGMARLCSQADVIIPNMTEAAFIAGQDYREGPYTTDYINSLLDALTAKLGPRDIVLTGVCLEQGRLGAAAYSHADKSCEYVMAEQIPGYYHGTGDVFGSVLVSALTRGLGLSEAARLAVDFVVACVIRARDAGTPTREGVPFELELGRLTRLAEV